MTGRREDEVADGALYRPFLVPSGGGIPAVPALIGSITTPAGLRDA